MCVEYQIILNKYKYKYQETDCALTLDQIFVGLLCCRFLLSEDSNLPSSASDQTSLNNNRPRRAQVEVMFMLNTSLMQLDSCFGGWTMIRIWMRLMETNCPLSVKSELNQGRRV